MERKVPKKFNECLGYYTEANKLWRLSGFLLRYARISSILIAIAGIIAGLASFDYYVAIFIVAGILVAAINFLVFYILRIVLEGFAAIIQEISRISDVLLYTTKLQENKNVQDDIEEN